MRYFSLILFSAILIFSVDFATQNTDNVILIYTLDWLNFSFLTARPVFVPVFFSFAFGLIFSVFYFFFYHASLLRNKHKQTDRYRTPQIDKTQQIQDTTQTQEKKMIIALLLACGTAEEDTAAMNDSAAEVHSLHHQ